MPVRPMENLDESDSGVPSSLEAGKASVSPKVEPCQQPTPLPGLSLPVFQRTVSTKERPVKPSPETVEVEKVVPEPNPAPGLEPNSEATPEPNSGPTPEPNPDPAHDPNPDPAPDSRRISKKFLTVAPSA